MRSLDDISIVRARLRVMCSSKRVSTRMAAAETAAVAVATNRRISITRMAAEGLSIRLVIKEGCSQMAAVAATAAAGLSQPSRHHRRHDDDVHDAPLPHVTSSLVCFGAGRWTLDAPQREMRRPWPRAHPFFWLLRGQTFLHALSCVTKRRRLLNARSPIGTCVHTWYPLFPGIEHYRGEVSAAPPLAPSERGLGWHPDAVILENYRVLLMATVAHNSLTAPFITNMVEVKPNCHKKRRSITIFPTVSNHLKNQPYHG